MLGALGGFVLPPAWAYLNQWTGAPQTTFASLTVLTAISTGWFYASQVVVPRALEPAGETTFEMAS
jgi:NNP family nitrate/nitrite transporter-like MFS transporter